jgi:hypothetical protein
MVTIRYAGDPDDLYPKWERAVELWKEEFGARFSAPDTIVAKSESGTELVVVNVFPDDEAHTNFGRNLGGALEAVGLSQPVLEHLDVLKIDFDAYPRT